MKKQPRALRALLMTLALAVPAALHAGEIWDTWKDNVRATWKSDEYSLIIPVNTYHSRLTYDRETLKRYNEIPWGLGIEKYYMDGNNNRHSLYALAFSASYKHVQPVVGYAWEKQFYLNESRSTRLGLGYTAFITARQQNSYIPFPGVLPMLSLGHKHVFVQTTWVPYLGRNNGNVYLTVVKVQVKSF